MNDPTAKVVRRRARTLSCAAGETRVFGRDQSVRGLLRVTLAPTLATHLLMPDFADFARLHPDIEMEILSSGDLANLTKPRGRRRDPRRLRRKPCRSSSRPEGPDCSAASTCPAID